MRSDVFVEECDVAGGPNTRAVSVKSSTTTAAADKIRRDSCRVISADTASTFSLYFNFPNPVAQSSFPTVISVW